MKIKPSSIASPFMIVAAVLLVCGTFLYLHSNHVEPGGIFAVTIYEDRTRWEDYVGEMKRKLFRMPENRDDRYLNIGGAPFEIGGASSTQAWFYLNHPELDNRPQWEIALSNRKSLEEVTVGDLQSRFYGMNDPEGTAAFGADWQGHTVRVPEKRVALLRAATNQNVTYAIELLEVNRGRGVRRSVEVRHRLVAH